MNPQIVIRGYKQALEFCLSSLNSLVIQVNDDPKERRNMLIRCA
jgi:chaperonin GroEL (HSP60 family)